MKNESKEEIIITSEASSKQATPPKEEKSESTQEASKEPEEPEKPVPSPATDEQVGSPGMQRPSPEDLE